MTARRLRQEPIASPLYAVVGACDSEHAVFHVGVLANANDLADDQEIDVFDMANAVARLRLPGIMKAHAVGWLDDLTDEEQSSIADWLDQLALGLKNDSIKVDYSACPAWEDRGDRVNSRSMERRFSCAGFVWCCFAESLGVEIVAREPDLPEVDIRTLEQVWGERAMRVAPRYGLRGPPPWRVLLPSYLFHALSRGRATMPHRPTHPDPCYPLELRRRAWEWLRSVRPATETPERAE